MCSVEMSALVQTPEHDTIEPSNDITTDDVSDDVIADSLHASKKRFFIGVTIVLLIAVTWVGSTQSGKETYTSHFNAPYFTIWFSTSWMIFTYPVCISLYLWLYGSNLSELWRCSTFVFSEKGITLRSLATSTLPFTIIWEATNYMYLRALGTIPPTDVTALFSSAPAFVYILSFFILREPLLVLRVFSVVLAISGITLFAYSDGFGSASLLGVSLAVLSAVGAALYKVCKWGCMLDYMCGSFVGMSEEKSWGCRFIPDVSFSQFPWLVQPASLLAYSDHTAFHWSGGDKIPLHPMVTIMCLCFDFICL